MQTNTTVAYSAPLSTDPLARYAASTTQLLQLTPNGTLAYIDLAVASDSAWTALNITLPAANSSTTGSTTGMGSAGNSNGSPAAAGSNTGTGVSQFAVPALAGLAAVALLAAAEQLF